MLDVGESESVRVAVAVGVRESVGEIELVGVEETESARAVEALRVPVNDGVADCDTKERLVAEAVALLVALHEGVSDSERVCVADAVCVVEGVPDLLTLALGVVVWEADRVLLMLPLWLHVCVTVAVSLWIPEADRLRVQVKLEDPDGDWLVDSRRLALEEELVDCERV